MSQIEVKNLTYVYSAGAGTPKRALNCINLSIEKGEFIGLIGPTGSGKSTFAKQLNALLKPTSGAVLLDGVDIWRNSQAKPELARGVRFKVGLVFQYPEYQLFEDTVYNDIAFGPKNMGLCDADVKEKVLAACKFVNLDLNLLQKSPFDLSGGEKRKVAIAGVLSMDPEVLVLDEPTVGLDPCARESLLEQLYRYHKEKDKTIILISHRMEDIAKYSDRVIVLSDGNLVMFDSAGNVFGCDKVLNEAGLKVPQICSIMTKLKAGAIPDLNDKVLTVDGAVTELLKFV